MRSTEMTTSELREARDAADTLISEKFRSYLPGRMLPMLLGKFRDDIAEAVGMELPPLSECCWPGRVAKLDDLTSTELDALSGAVLVLVTRFISRMDDPVLPELLREFRVSLMTERADRARIAEELKAKARAS